MPLYINSIGVRSGEYIQGVGKQCKGTIMEVVGEYPNARKFIPDMNTIRDELSNYPFFANMSIEERYNYLSTHAVDNTDLYLDDVDVQVRFLNISGDFFNQFPDIVNTLLSGNKLWSIKDVYNMFPRKPGSRARKHTLVFRPTNWAPLAVKPNITYNGFYISLDDGSIGYGNVNNALQVSQHIAIIGTKQPNTRVDKEALYALGSNIQEVKEVAEHMEWYTPALHKSVIQKLIRTHAKYVTIDGRQYQAVNVLVASITTLLGMSGSFVPNIQRYVTGKEAAFKRVVVSIFEDAYSEYPQVLAQCLAIAYYIQHHPEYIPSIQAMQNLIVIAITAMQDNRYYDYRHVTGNISSYDHLYACYVLLSAIGSFESDIRMVLNIAISSGRYAMGNVTHEHAMNIEHAIDQHVYPEVAYMFGYNPLVTYTDLFSLIWEYSSKFNPRKQVDDRNEVIAHAKELTYLWKRPKVKQTRPNNNNTYTFNYDLHPGYLAGLVGSVEVGNMIVVLNTHNIEDMLVVRRPKREDKEVKLVTDHEKQQAIHTVQQMLRQGINVNDGVIQGIIKLTDNGYLLNNVPWEDAIHLHYNIPEHSNIENTIDNAIIYDGSGVNEHADIILDYNLQQQPIEVVRRLAMYITGYKSKISMFKIGRDGTGVEYSVNPTDTGAFHMLCYICNLYPAALVLEQDGFKVKNAPLFYRIRDRILGYLRGRHVFATWPVIRGDDRILRDYQQDALNELIQRSGSKGHIIWIEVGMGKTLILMSYLKYLAENHRLPKYVVYTLPTSAFDSIKRELSMFGLPYYELDMRKGSRQTIIQPFTVNLLAHDHMRMNGMDQQLRNLSNEMFFICDEFHLCLSSKTIRTSLALEIARLSVEFVAMSGTILNAHDAVEDLIAWLEQVVPYPVTTKNYYVAVGSLIARKVNTGVQVDRYDIDVPMDEMHAQQYKPLVTPKLGGTGDRVNMQEALRICYDVINNAMIEGIIYYVQRGIIPFVVARNIEHQETLANMLSLRMDRNNIYLVSRDHPITLTPNDTTHIQVVITTVKHSTGYTLTKCPVMITSVYFSNEATREQLEGRINRIGQTSNIAIVTYHTGLLSYVYANYKHTRNMLTALKGFARDVGYELQL